MAFHGLIDEICLKKIANLLEDAPDSVLFGGYAEITFGVPE